LFCLYSYPRINLTLQDVCDWINYGVENIQIPNEWSFNGYLDDEDEATEEEIDKAERQGEISEEAQKIVMDVLSTKFKLLIELNPEAFKKEAMLFRKIKNFLWDEFENLKVCVEDSEEWNSFRDMVNNFE
tara:strand:- start:157 stop:546 length:390 start_codon:yes stop_codon:yes gene_type:complete